jgi:hypothetical protein
VQKTPERLAFEADRLRLRLEVRIVEKSILNVLEAKLEEVHLSHNEHGLIPRVSLDISDLSEIDRASQKLLGTVNTEAVDDHS